MRPLSPWRTMDSRMYRAIGIIAILAIAAAPHSYADQTSKTKKIEEIFQLTKVDQMMSVMQGQIKARFNQQLAASGIPDAPALAADLDKQLTPVMNEALNWQKLKPRMLQIYNESFTEDEVSGILQFYRSPAGRAMLDKTPTLMAKSAAVSQEAMKEAMPKIAEVSTKVMEKYKAAHPRQAPPQPAKKN